MSRKKGSKAETLCPLAMKNGLRKAEAQLVPRIHQVHEKTENLKKQW